jgi:enoyl-CoA hydratase/carnithine racemase
MALGGGVDQSLALLQATLSVATATSDAAEGVAAFAEKRRPVWGEG